jgi:hypothetical protein
VDTRQDPVAVAPHAYRVLFDNDRVRVLEVQMQPGERTELHAHPDAVWHLTVPIKARFTAPDGTAVEGEFPAGVMWRDAEIHAVENIGKDPFAGIAVELKQLR